MVLLPAILGLLCYESPSFGQARIRADSDLVLVQASVMDRRDHLVLGLPRDHFRLFEDRRQQRVTHFAVEEAPVSVTFVVDSSRSMARSLPEVQSAVNIVLDAARSEDEAALVTFDDHPGVAVPFSSEVSPVRQAVGRLTARGGTSLVDALALALQYTKRHAARSRRAVLVFSDGGERDSRYTWSELRAIARESDTRVYVFLSRSALDDEDASGPRFLRQISEETGGREIVAPRGERLREAAEKLDLHWQYVLGYKPADSPRDGKYHRVDIKLNDSDLKIFWRKGYVASP